MVPLRRRFSSHNSQPRWMLPAVEASHSLRRVVLLTSS